MGPWSGWSLNPSGTSNLENVIERIHCLPGLSYHGQGA